MAAAGASHGRPAPLGRVCFSHIYRPDRRRRSGCAVPTAQREIELGGLWTQLYKLRQGAERPDAALMAETAAGALDAIVAGAGEYRQYLLAAPTRGPRRYFQSCAVRNTGPMRDKTVCALCWASVSAFIGDDHG